MPHININIIFTIVGKLSHSTYEIIYIYETPTQLYMRGFYGLDMHEYLNEINGIIFLPNYKLIYDSKTFLFNLN